MPSVKKLLRPPSSRQSAGAHRAGPPDGGQQETLPAVQGHAEDEWTCLSRSAADTDRLGRLLGGSLRGGEVIAIYGELGSGKTALVRGIAAGIGAPPRAVGSPTFVLIHEYQGRVRVAHADLYRIQSPTELDHLGLSDYLDDRTVMAVEWADRAGSHLPADRLEVHLTYRNRTSRTVRLRATGARSRDLLDHVRSSWSRT